MVDVAGALRLAAYALGAVGAGLLFIELFQLPSYLEYRQEFTDYKLTMMPEHPTEYTWVGRTGALLLALTFALLFLAALL